MVVRTTLLLLTAATIALAQSAPAPLPASGASAFEVVTVKPTARRDGAWKLQPTPDGYTGMDVSLHKLVQEAYGVFDDSLLTGGPPWVDTDRFDLEAKFDPASVPNAKDLTYRQRADMLRSVLAARFQLKVHLAKKDFPVFNLVVAKGGPKMPVWKSGSSVDVDAPKGCLFRRSGASFLDAENCSVDALLLHLRYITGRTVLDKTALTGHYHLILNWTPENTPADSPIAGGPSIFTALQEQLGLKLEPSTAPLDILIIDSAKKPSVN
jgi:uncharacterized protein (TIGR03435 family)